MAGECAQALSALVAEIRSSSVEIAAVQVYDSLAPSTTQTSLSTVRKGLADVVSGALFVVGTDDYFAELNRNRVVPRLMGADAVTFSLTPQVHDSTSHAVLETVESIPAMIETARTLSGGASVTVSPVTLKPRRNIHAVNAVIDRVGRDAGSTDERQRLPFAAAWFITSLATLSLAGASRLTFAEIAGPRGLVPAGPHSEADRYPIFYAVAALRGARYGIFRSLSRTGVVDAVGFFTANGVRVIIVNLTPGDQCTDVEGVGPTMHLTLAPYEFRVLNIPTAKLKATTP